VYSGVGERIDDMNRASLERDAAAHRAAIGRDRILPQDSMRPGSTSLPAAGQ